MQTPDPVETILARLMPVAMSPEGQRGIEAMLDELAGPAVEIIALKPWYLRARTAGIAAAGIAAAVMLSWVVMRPPGVAPAAGGPARTPPGVILIGGSGSIRSMAEEGWQEDSDGTAMRTLRLRVVEENTLLDEETGIVMMVSEPREETLLMPVSAF